MNVVFLDIVHSILEERLTKAGYSCVDASDLSLDDCKNVLATADGIVVRSRFPMDATLLDYAPNLKFIARSGAGMENIDEAYSAARNIQLFNAPEGNRNAVAEHALGMILSLFNRIPQADKEVRNGKWNREENRGIELDGKTVGIIGFGNNGRAFAKKLRGFDVNLLAFDKYISGFGDDFVHETTLNELFEKADIISLHIPQNEETLFFVNDHFIASCKKNFYLINLARGKVVQTSSLVSGLKSGKILGACLDVLEYEKSSFESFFEQEIPSDFRYLLNSEKVLLSPHVGGWTHESYFKLSNVLADKILAKFG